MDWAVTLVEQIGWAFWSFAFLLVALGILVTIHEFGHFYVARLCGVRVLRFSVGFGKVLWSKEDSKGTEFAISMLPLGGYVKMLGEQPELQDQLSEELQAESLTSKSPWQRMAIAFAGPAANFLFAILAYWVLHVVGVTVTQPYVGIVAEDSPVATAGMTNGQLISAVDGKPTASWPDVALAVAGRLGDTGSITFSAKSPNQQSARDYAIPIQEWLAQSADVNPLVALGFDYAHPPAVLGEVISGSPADQSDLLPGDWILAADGEAVADWLQWVNLVRAAPGRSLPVLINRNGTELAFNVQVGVREEDGIGYLGIYRPTIQVIHGPVKAVGRALQSTWDMTILTLSLVKKMFTGLVSLSNIGGPLTIADAAGTAATGGFENFVYLLALLSISLGIVNLLPVPVLDGGHIAICMLEIVRGRPLSIKAQAVALRIGVSLVLALMILAVVNDLNRFIWTLGG